MKLSVRSADLQKKLENLHKISKTKTTLSVLNYLLMEVTDSEIQFTASDLEVTLVSKVMPEEVKETGSVCVLADTFAEIIKKLPDCVLTITDNKNAIVIKSKGGTFKIPCVSAEDFPIGREPSEENIFSIPSSVLANGINKTYFAIAPDSEREYRPTLCGVFADFKQDKTTFVATDRNKVAVVFDGQYSSQDQSVILPKKLANTILSVFGQSETNVDVCFDDKNIKLESAEYTVYSKLIEGEYVNYNYTLNQSVNVIVTARTEELLKAIDRVMLFCPNLSSILQMSVQIGQLEISGEDVDFNLSAEENVVCENRQGSGIFKCNGRFLYETLQKIKTEFVEISFSDQHPIVYFNPVNTEENYLFAILKCI